MGLGLSAFFAGCLASGSDVTLDGAGAAAGLDSDEGETPPGSIATLGVSVLVEAGKRGWAGLRVGTEPGIWRATGPPLPPELVEAYHRYYLHTHSLVWLAGVALVAWLAGARRWVWLAVPYALHIVMDIPTHERFLTQPFFPLSSWTFLGLSWGDPRVFVPNVVALALVYSWWLLRLWKKSGTSACAGESRAGRRAPQEMDS
ncbi:MAG: hypothetical protein ABIK62_01165 [candidate division WOR-3 bacterium]